MRKIFTGNESAIPLWRRVFPRSHDEIIYYAILIRHELSPRDHMFRLDTRKKCKLFLKVKLESIIARFAELKNVL